MGIVERGHMVDATVAPMEIVLSAPGDNFSVSNRNIVSLKAGSPLPKERTKTFLVLSLTCMQEYYISIHIFLFQTDSGVLSCFSCSIRFGSILM